MAPLLKTTEKVASMRPIMLEKLMNSTWRSAGGRESSGQEQDASQERALQHSPASTGLCAFRPGEIFCGVLWK